MDCVFGLATHYGRYGYRQITGMLRQACWRVNSKRVERIWCQEGLKVSVSIPSACKLRRTRGSCVRLRARRPNQFRISDLAHDRTHDGRALRMLLVIDEYTRECLPIRTACRLYSLDILDCLGKLVFEAGLLESVRSDYGAEFTAEAARKWMDQLGVKTQFIEPGSPWENGYVEFSTVNYAMSCLA